MPLPPIARLEPRYASYLHAAGQNANLARHIYEVIRSCLSPIGRRRDIRPTARASALSAATLEVIVRPALRVIWNKLRDLRAKREASVDAFERAVEKAVGKLRGMEYGGSHGRSAPHTTDAPAEPSPTGKPAASPATRTAAGPAPGGTPPPLSGASNPAADAINNLMAAARQPSQPIPFLQPQQAAMSPATPSPVVASPAARRPGDDKDRALSSRDLGLDGAPVVAPVTVPATTAPSPAATPTPAPTPATSGTSVNDLRAATDVSGRSDVPRVRLSAGTATNATGTATGTNPVADRSISPGMTPPFMGPPGRVISRGKSDKKIVQHNAEDAELQGINTIGEAVRGGTILQRRYDDGTGAA